MRYGLDAFTRSYIETAFWSSTLGDDQGTPLDQDYSADDLSPETLATMQADCKAFYDAMSDLFSHASGDSSEDEMAGHDFWLTRNGHGCGFWDGDYPEPEASLLTMASKAFGECDLYVGDDSQVYVS